MHLCYSRDCHRGQLPLEFNFILYHQGIWGEIYCVLVLTKYHILHAEMSGIAFQWSLSSIHKNLFQSCCCSFRWFNCKD